MEKIYAVNVMDNYSGSAGAFLEKNFPEIINATRITGRGFRLTYNDRSFDEVVVMAAGFCLSDDYWVVDIYLSCSHGIIHYPTDCKLSIL